MFTGIIEGLGTIREIRQEGQGKRMTVDAEFFLEQTKIGDSISVSGACLTVVMIGGKRFAVDVSPETLAKTTFKSARIGDRVNLERALRISDRIDGHLVSGHIDGIGTVMLKQNIGNAIIVSFKVPELISHYMIQKGSVAVDGISLTINNCGRDSFDVSIILHTAKWTTIGFKKAGDLVNIETDMIGKYVERFVGDKRRDEKKRGTGNSLDMEFLTKTGFF
ncbi:MAG: riboflavin synthase [Deltaproteobacteria bacterium]|nr:riboflavin synthase [Deltaproteobacteria bacterium]